MNKEACGPYLGKYRGTVVNNLDPNLRGRLTLMVPDVLGSVPSSWAEASLPLAGPTGPPMGMFVLPPIGTGVWVEFESGDPNKPVWVGCRLGAQSDVPSAGKAGLPAAPNIVIQSLTQNRIVISSVPSEGVTIEMGTGQLGPRIELSATGLKLSYGPKTSIQLDATGVSINGGALRVTL